MSVFLSIGSKYYLFSCDFLGSIFCVRLNDTSVILANIVLLNRL